MAKITGSFFPGLTGATLDRLSEYLEVVECQLKSVEETEEEQILEEIEDLELSAEAEWIERNLAMQEHRPKHDMLFPNFLRYSFVVLIVLILENKLRELCAIVAKSKGKDSPVYWQGAIKKYKKFLESNCVSVDEDDYDYWRPMHDLKKVRNCIVHASGDVTLSKDKVRLRDVAHEDPNLAISGRNYEGEDVPLYFEDDMLVLTTDYCRDAVADVKTLFKKLCDAVPLRGITIEGDAS